MNNPLKIPEHIRKAAATVEIFFKVNGINEWALMGIQSRRSEPEPMEHCENCNTPLSACGEQGVDGIPTMDCQAGAGIIQPAPELNAISFKIKNPNP